MTKNMDSRSSGSWLAAVLSGLVFALVVTSQPVRAADEATAEDATPAPQESFKEQFNDVWTRDKFLGDWGGLRTDLLDHGIDVGLRLSHYGQSVADGGVDTNTEFGGTMDYRVNADLRKLFDLWDGLSLTMHARTRYGKDIGADAGGLVLPNTGLLQPNPGDYSGTAVTGLMANQIFPLSDTHLGFAAAGKIDIIDAVTLFFPEVNYGQEGFMNVNGLVSALPWFGAVDGLSLYGGWLATVNKEFGIGQSAILVTGTEDVSTRFGNLHDSFDQGAWVAAFHRFLYKLDDKPGYFMIFGGFSTRDQVSNIDLDYITIPGSPGSEFLVPTLDEDEEKPWDIALYLSQVFWQAEGDPNRKASILIGGTAGPDDPQFAQYNFFTALEAWGPIASRPYDRVGVAGWYNWLSDDFEEFLSPVVELRDQYGFEVYYNVAVNKWLHVSADLQLVENEFEGDDLAIIPGVRFVIDF